MRALIKAILIIVLFGSHILCAQELGSFRYDFHSDTYYGGNIVYFNDSLIVQNNYIYSNSPTDSFKQLLFRINNVNGQDTSYKIYPTKFYPFGSIYRQSMSIDSKGNLYITGLSGDTDTSRNAIVIRIKANGKIDWEKQYNNYPFGVANSPMVKNDNEIVFDVEYGINKKYWDLQEYVWIDSTGAVLKRKEVPIGDYHHVENPNSMLLPDGSIVMTAQGFYYGSPDPFNRIVRLDKDGNMKWEIKLDRIRDANRPTLVCPLQNGNFIAVSSNLSDILYFKDGMWVQDPTRIYLIDSTGKVLKTNDMSSHGLQMRYRPSNILPLSNGDVCITGDGYINSGPGPTDELFAGFLARVSPDLEYKWRRLYYDSTTEVYNSYIYDGTELPNGDLAFCGELFGVGHDLWVLKVDSNGCFSPNCSDTDTSFIWTAVEDHSLKENISYMRLYPNPTSGNLSIDLAEALHSEGTFRFKVIDMQARVYYQGEIQGFTTPHTIDVHDLASGMYILELSDRAGKVLRRKFVKSSIKN